MKAIVVDGRCFAPVDRTLFYQFQAHMPAEITSISLLCICSAHDHFSMKTN